MGYLDDFTYQTQIFWMVSQNRGTPIAGWFIMEIRIKIRMIVRGTPMTQETSISSHMEFTWQLDGFL